MHSVFQMKYQVARYSQALGSVFSGKTVWVLRPENICFAEMVRLGKKNFKNRNYVIMLVFLVYLQLMYSLLDAEHFFQCLDFLMKAKS